MESSYTLRARLRVLLGCVLVINVFIVAAQPLTRPAYAAPNLPAGFVSEVVIANLTAPTTIAFAADNRIFIGQKNGVVRVWQAGALLSTPFINISAEVNNSWDRGLLGLAVHPDFPNTPYVYLAYTYDPPGATADGSGARVSRVLRVTADAANPNVAATGAGAQVVILGVNSTLANSGDITSFDNGEACGDHTTQSYVADCLPSDSPSHSIGSVAFGTDSMLFVSHGDGAHFNYTDARAIRALDLGSLAGKLLRIDPLTGAGLSDNPFYDGNPNSNRSKVYNLGLRNPFRFSFDSAKLFSKAAVVSSKEPDASNTRSKIP